MPTQSTLVENEVHDGLSGELRDAPHPEVQTKVPMKSPPVTMQRGEMQKAGIQGPPAVKHPPIFKAPPASQPGLPYTAGTPSRDQAISSPLRTFLTQLVVTPFGLLGTSMDENGNSTERGELPPTGTIVVDPSGLRCIRTGPQTAKGASAALYRWLGLDETGTFPKAILDALTRTGQA